MKKFDKQTAKAIGQEIEDALQAVARRHNVSIYYGGGVIRDDLNFTLKLHLRVQDAEVVASVEQNQFTAYCGAYGCKPEHYRAKFSSNGNDYELRGFDIGRSKFCIKARNLTEAKDVLFKESVLRRVPGTRAAEQVKTMMSVKQALGVRG